MTAPRLIRSVRPVDLRHERFSKSEDRGRISRWVIAINDAQFHAALSALIVFVCIESNVNASVRFKQVPFLWPQLHHLAPDCCLFRFALALRASASA